ncbi:formate dehydrogenase subunit alpha [Sesbania bispinosa]|nr:formate dehydrogenase subunit alpha [Sesbania bispinosa]
MKAARRRGREEEKQREGGRSGVCRRRKGNRHLLHGRCSARERQWVKRKKWVLWE